MRGHFLAAAVAATILASASVGRGQPARMHIRAFSANVVVPQARAVRRPAAPPAVEVTGVKVGVAIVEQVATTTMDIDLRNPSGSRIEAELLVPVPEGAAIRGFTFHGAGSEPTAELLPKDQAIAAYKAIVAKIKDPALLEFAGYNLIRTSVFPIDPRGTQKIRLIYEHLLTADGDRVDYVLPRTEAIDYSIPWDVSMTIKAKRPISTVYSPSHEVDFCRTARNAGSVRASATAMREPGPFQLSYLLEGSKGITASLLAYPDPKIDGGYFLLLAGLPAKVREADDAPAVQREVTLVIDRSGSMAGEKLDQAKAAAVQVLQGLRDGEAVNVIDYSDSIASFAAAPVVKTDASAEKLRHYIRRLRSGGGTNLHDALIEAVRQRPTEAMLPIVLFLTDGLPTVGVRDEVAIRTAVAKANVHKRRIFTFGVGYDVNTPLLTHLALNSRAASTFVLPNEDVEVKVSQVYRRLSGPVLSEPSLAVVDADGQRDTQRVRDVLPRQLPDLFEGDKLVLLGRYTDGGPLRFRLAGEFRGRPRTFRFEFGLDKATARNGFVPRLWASRKIAALVDAIRQAGAATGSSPSVLSAAAATDPKLKELVDEIVRLSIEFGVLTEYTAFLAKEGTDLARRDRILTEANTNFVDRAQRARVGQGAVNQSINNDFQRGQIRGNRRNWFYDQNMERVQITNVQQINDRAFFQRGNRWIDGSALNSAGGAKVDRTVKIGSPEFMKLLERLVADHRQGTLSMSGEIVLRLDDRNILITGE